VQGTVQPETGSLIHGKVIKIVKIPEPSRLIHGKCSNIVKIPEGRHPWVWGFSAAATHIYLYACEKI
tara:strand:+ start:630 stop:830 length:201 start_codon:yes stop_codon:yes gene_type:complete